MLRNVRRPRTHIAPNFQNTQVLRDKLIQEIAELQSKLDGMDLSPSQDIVSSVQSYKTMIHSRQQMLGDLAKQKDQRTRYGATGRMQ
jgi:predicted house-cleaning noncanonical NTP pyrophosphatase (MazG superfamily)